MKKETVQISDRTCTIYKSERPEYLLIQPIDEHDLAYWVELVKSQPPLDISLSPTGGCQIPPLPSGTSSKVAGSCAMANAAMTSARDNSKNLRIKKIVITH